MERYNYLKAIKQDIRNYITENFTNEEINELLTDRITNEEKLYDILWIEDSVTGNASGSYTFNTWEAEENITHNWDILIDAINEFGCNTMDILSNGAEWCDVTIRCFLLAEALSEVLNYYEIII